MPSQIRRLHNATKPFPKVRRNRMTIAQPLFRHHELAIGIKNYEVGIKAWCDSPFVQLTAGKLGGLLRHPSRNIQQSKSSRTGFRPHDRQGHREARNPAPRSSEVAFVEPL